MPVQILGKGKLSKENSWGVGGWGKRGVEPGSKEERAAEATKSVLVAQLCPTLCDPMGDRLPGSSVHGILQARILACISILFSRASS